MSPGKRKTEPTGLPRGCGLRSPLKPAMLGGLLEEQSLYRQMVAVITGLSPGNPELTILNPDLLNRYSTVFFADHPKFICGDEYTLYQTYTVE